MQHGWRHCARFTTGVCSLKVVMVRLILGSKSPRRQEILSSFTLSFEQVAPSFDEDSIPFTGDPEKYVTTISKGKANQLAARYPDAIILTADTTVYREGKIYGKPIDEEDAFRSLSELVGKWHTVYTGVSVQFGKKEYHQVESTRVLFNELSPDQIRHYLLRMHWADKAGGYAIQLVGGLIVKRIEGCYYNVMGLPINTVHTLLKHVNIDLWNFI